MITKHIHQVGSAQANHEKGVSTTEGLNSAFLAVLKGELKYDMMIHRLPQLSHRPLARLGP